MYTCVRVRGLEFRWRTRISSLTLLIIDYTYTVLFPKIQASTDGLWAIIDTQLRTRARGRKSLKLSLKHKKKSSGKALRATEDIRHHRVQAEKIMSVRRALCFSYRVCHMTQRELVRYAGKLISHKQKSECKHHSLAPLDCFSPKLYLTRKQRPMSPSPHHRSNAPTVRVYTQRSIGSGPFNGPVRAGAPPARRRLASSPRARPKT